MVWNKLAKKYDRLWVQKYSLAPTRKAVIDIIMGIENRRRGEMDAEQHLQNDAARLLKNEPDSEQNLQQERISNSKVVQYLVDIGCGTGQLLNEISSMNNDLIKDERGSDTFHKAARMKLMGFDKSDEMIACAKSKEIDASFFCADIADSSHPLFKLRDPLSLNPQNPLPFNPKDPSSAFPDGGFDLAVCCHSFPYYKDKIAAVERIADLIRPDGIVIFAQASINSLYDKAILSVIEKTAEKADYLSREDFLALTEVKFDLVSEFGIRERWFMPSIRGFVMRKR